MSDISEFIVILHITPIIDLWFGIGTLILTIEVTENKKHLISLGILGMCLAVILAVIICVM